MHVDMSGRCNMCRDDDAVAMMEDETETETETSLLQLLLGNNDVETIIEDPPASASAAAVDALGRRNKSLWPKNNSSQDKKWGDHFDIYLALDMSGKDASANEISSTAYLSEASLRDIADAAADDLIRFGIPHFRRIILPISDLSCIQT